MTTPAPTAAEQTGTRTGTIIALAYSAELINNVAKETHQDAEITRFGIPGDRHYGETRISRGLVVPNNRPITVVGVEALRSASERLGIPPVPPGGLGENILTEGLGDLGDLGPGDRLHIISASGKPSAILEVRKQNEPCSNLLVYHKQMVKELYGKRGLLCTVLKEGRVAVGDRIELVKSVVGSR